MLLCRGGLAAAPQGEGGAGRTFSWRPPSPSPPLPLPLPLPPPPPPRQMLSRMPHLWPPPAAVTPDAGNGPFLNSRGYPATPAVHVLAPTPPRFCLPAENSARKVGISLNCTARMMLSRRRLPPDLSRAELAAAAAVAAAAGWERELAAEPRPSRGRAGDKPEPAAWGTKSCCDPSPRNPLVALLAGLVPHVRLVAPLALRLWDLSADRMAAAAVTGGPRLCCFSCCWRCGEEGSTCQSRVGLMRGGGRGRRGKVCQGGGRRGDR